MSTQFTSSHHHHGLSLTSYQSRYNCGGCFMDGHGERYRCCTDSCNFDLHKECLNPNPIRTLDIFSAPAPKILKLIPNRPPPTGRIFKFLDRPPPAGPSETCCLTTYCGSCRACNVCGLTVKGFVYHCPTKGKTGLDVHPLCASLDKEIHVEGVKFKLREGVPYSKCTWCNRERLEGSVRNVPGFCYVSRGSEDQGCSFHVACLMEMGIKYGKMTVVDNSSASASRNNVDDDINRLGQELVKAKKKNIVKFGKVVGLFLKVVLSVIFGDPTAIFASMVVHFLKS